MTTRAFFALGLSALLLACSDDPSSSDDGDSGAIPGLDAGNGADGRVTSDGGTEGGSDAGDDATPPDTTAPMAIADLAATTASHTSIALAWTAPVDPPNGKASSYELRWSKTNIASVPDFTAATAVTVPAPKSAGSNETFTVTGLEPDTTYFFAIRAKDASGNVGPLSNVASAATKARATLLVAEVAMTNPAGSDGSPGFDFIELVAAKAGNLKGVEVRQAGSPTLVHTFADLDVALGDRIVVHLTGLPGPTGFAQEDAANSKTASTETAAFGSTDAYDVYSSGTGLVATDNLISVVDGTTIVDAVAYSGRDGDASATSMTAFATAKANGSWTFTATPVDATNDCETQREAVAISTSFGTEAAAGTCGRFATGMGAGKSINRVGTTDTNAKKDWYVAAQTPGAENTALVAPKLVATVATSLTTVDLRFDQEIDGSTVAKEIFTGSGITIANAVLGDASFVTLTTSTQNGPHTIGVDAATLKSVYGMSVDASTVPARFCGYEPLGGMVLVGEINPKISGADLVELKTTRAGSIGGFSVRENPTAGSGGGLVVNVPDGFCVALGDLIVVHMQPATPPAMPNETLAKDEVPTAVESSYYDGAWDLRGGSSGLIATDSVIAVRDASDAYVDAVVLTNGDGSSTTTFQDALAYIQGLGLWMPADCAGAKCTDATTPTAQGIAVSLSGVGTSAAGNSLQRTAATPTAASWSVAASSWGN